MKRRMCSVVFASSLIFGLGCASPGPGARVNNGETNIGVTGTEGARVSGYYVQDGRRVPIEAVLPLSLSHVGLSEFEVVKERPEQTLALAAQYDDRGWHSETVSEAGAGVAALRVLVCRGITVEKVKE